jgi:predicted MFS family arabinose efflux permease
MGYSTMVLSVGTAMFPLAGGLLGDLGWRYPFFMSLSAIPLALLVQLYLHNPEPQGTEGFRAYVRATLSALLTAKAIAILLLTFLTSLILFGPFVTYLPVVLGRKFHVSSATIGFVVSTASIFTFLASSQVGRLSARGGMRVSILRAAFLLYLSAMLIVPLEWELWMFLIPVALFGAGMGLNTPIRVSLLGELAPMRNRASIMSVNNMSLRTGQTVSPVAMGVVAAGLGLDAVYLVGACLALMMLLLVKTAARQPRSPGAAGSPGPLT